MERVSNAEGMAVATQNSTEFSHPRELDLVQFAATVVALSEVNYEGFENGATEETYFLVGKSTGILDKDKPEFRLAPGWRSITENSWGGQYYLHSLVENQRGFCSNCTVSVRRSDGNDTDQDAFSDFAKSYSSHEAAIAKIFESSPGQYDEWDEAYDWEMRILSYVYEREQAKLEHELLVRSLGELTVHVDQGEDIPNILGSKMLVMLKRQNSRLFPLDLTGDTEEEYEDDEGL